LSTCLPQADIYEDERNAGFGPPTEVNQMTEAANDGGLVRFPQTLLSFYLLPIFAAARR